MQILQCQLGMTFPPLGQNSSLGIANSFFSKKNSNLLHLSSFIKPLAILKPLLTSSHFLIEGGKNGHLRSWDNLKTALKTDFSNESAKFQFENLDNNLEIYENANENNENFIEKPKNLKKSSKKTSNTDNSNRNVASSELVTRKNAKSKKETKPQSKANSLAKSKKATKKNSAKKVESRAIQQSLNAEQEIAANSPTVVPIPEILTPVGVSDVPNNVTTKVQPQPSVSDVPNNSTTETQTTQPSQPSRHKPTASTSQQIPPVTPTVITPDVNNKLKPTQLPGASTTASPTLGNESTVMRQSLNAEQRITPDSPTVVPTLEILTPVEESNVPNNVTIKAQPQPSILDLSNNVTAQTQTTQPSQPNLDSTSIETSLQNASVLPTLIPNVSTTTPPTLGNESTLMRQSLNAEQGIAHDSPTVVSTPETLTPVEQSNVRNHVTIETQTTQSLQTSVSDVPNNSTTQTQTTLRSQPNVDHTSTETLLQNALVLPTVITPDVNNKSQPTQLPGVSTTASPALGNESTLMRQSLNAEQGITPDSPTVVPTPQILTPVEESNVPNNVTIEAQPQPSILDLSNNVAAQTQTTQPSQPSQHKPTASTSQQIPPVTPTVITPDVNNNSQPTSIPGISTTAPATLGNESTLIRQSLNVEQEIAPDASVNASDIPNNATAQTQTTQPSQPNVDNTSTSISQQIAKVAPTVITPNVNNNSQPTQLPGVSATAPATLGNESTLMRQSLNTEQEIAPDASVATSDVLNNNTTQTTQPSQPNVDNTTTSTSQQIAKVTPTVITPDVDNNSQPTQLPGVSTTALPTLGNESTLMRQSLNAEQGIAPDSPTVVLTPETLTPVVASDVANNSTTETQTTQPSQPNLDNTTTHTSQQIAKVAPTVITPDVNNNSQPTQLPGVSETTPPTFGNESTLIRQSLNAEQGIAPDASVNASDIPNNATTETQTTQPSQPNVNNTTTSTSQQIPPVTPTVITPGVNNNSQPTQLPGVSTTASPTLGNESTLMRHLNAEQGITPDSPTVVLTPETLTLVGASDVPNNITTQAQPQPSILDLSNNSTTETQTTQPSQPSQHKPTASTSQQIPPVTPTLITPDVNNNSQPTQLPGVSETTPPALGDESTVVQQHPMGDLLNESSPKNPSFDNLLAPTGFATGGQVAATQVQASQSIAPSDTVAAMLTPGEFVINAQDTHKNLNLLEHINSGGRPENFISPKEMPISQDEGKSALASDHSTHTDYSNESLIQRESLDAIPTTSHALISSSIGQEIVGRQSISRPTFLQAYTKEKTITKVGKQSEQYSLPNLVFQESTPATNSPSETAPSQWSSVEELLGGSTNQSTAFDSEPVKFSRENLKFPTVSKSPKTAIRRKSVLQGFANKGKVTAPDEITSSNEALLSDIDTEAQPVTETIKSFCCSPPTENKIADDIETLAREIYNRLRQKLEIERERNGNGIYSGRLPW